MTALLLAVIATPIADLALKAALRHRLGTRRLSLGALGALGLSDHPLWLGRLTTQPDAPRLLLLLGLAAAPVLLLGMVLPSAGLFAGLLVGGAIGNALEHVRRGAVSDYVRLRFWPAFNLADAAILVGVVGLAVVVARLVT